MTTFAELTRIADTHLADALALTQSSTVAAQGTSAAIAKASGVLARYTDQVTTGFGLRRGRWSQTAQDCSGLLHRAAILAEAPGQADAYEISPLASRLRANAEALGCGLDLLASHTGTSASPTASVVATDSTSRHLLALVGRQAATLADIASRADDGAVAGVAPLLEQVAGAIPRGSDAGVLPVRAVTLRVLPARIAPIVGEDRGRTLEGIAATAQRIIEQADDGSVTTWRYAATGAAISHHVSSLLLRQLTGDTRTGQLFFAAGRVGSAANGWQQIVKALSKAIPGNHPTGSGLAEDVGDLVLRLGRLTHNDPAWLPNQRAARTTLAPRGVLAPNPKAAVRLTLSVLQAVEAFRVVADRHQALIATTPKPPKQLLQQYQQAREQGVLATTTLSKAVLELNTVASQPAIAEHAALILERATGPTTSEADFPIPISEALHAPTPTASRSRHPRSPARTSHTRTA